MSSHVRTLRSPALHSKPRTVRRHGACNPCKQSKTRCDGAEPCGACRSEKRKSRTCEYSVKARGIAAARQQSEAERKLPPSNINAGLESFDDTVVSSHVNQNSTTRSLQFHHSFVSPSDTRSSSQANASHCMSSAIAVFNVVHEFVKVKQPKGYAAQVIRRVIGTRNSHSSPSSDDSDLTTDDLEDTDVDDEDEPSSARALRYTNLNNKMRFMRKSVNNGHLRHAFITMGATLREIQLTLQGVWSLKERKGDPSNTEMKDLLLEFVELDALLSFGLGYSSNLRNWRVDQNLSTIFSDCSSEDQYRSTRLQIVQTMQEIVEFDMSSDQGISNFLQYANTFQDFNTRTAIEKIAACTTDDAPVMAQDLKIWANLILIVIYCRCASICDYHSQDPVHTLSQSGLSSDLIEAMNINNSRQKSIECRKVIKYANFILGAFTTLHKIDAEGTARNWLRCKSGLIAAELVAIAKLREKNTECQDVANHLRRIVDIFIDLGKRNPSSNLLKKAVRHIRDLNISKSQTLSISPTVSQTISAENVASDEQPVSIETTQTPDATDISKLPTASRKRPITAVDSPEEPPSPRKSQSFILSTASASHPPMALSIVPTPPFAIDQGDIGVYGDTSAVYTSNDGYGPSVSLNPSANTSFAEANIAAASMSNDPFPHPGHPFVYPLPSHVHPPMMYEPFNYGTDNYIPPTPIGPVTFAYDSSPVISNGPLGAPLVLNADGSVSVQSTLGHQPVVSPPGPFQVNEISGTFSMVANISSQPSILENDGFFQASPSSFDGHPSATSVSEMIRPGRANVTQSANTSRRQSVHELPRSISNWQENSSDPASVKRHPMQQQQQQQQQPPPSNPLQPANINTPQHPHAPNSNCASQFPYKVLPQIGPGVDQFPLDDPEDDFYEHSNLQPMHDRSVHVS